MPKRSHEGPGDFLDGESYVVGVPRDTIAESPPAPPQKELQLSPTEKLFEAAGFRRYNEVAPTNEGSGEERWIIMDMADDSLKASSIEGVQGPAMFLLNNKDGESEGRWVGIEDARRFWKVTRSFQKTK